MSNSNTIDLLFLGLTYLAILHKTSLPVLNSCQPVLLLCHFLFEVNHRSHGLDAFVFDVLEMEGRNRCVWEGGEEGEGAEPLVGGHLSGEGEEIR